MYGVGIGLEMVELSSTGQKYNNSNLYFINREFAEVKIKKSSGNSTQYSVITYMDKESEKE